jgi:hypothetical protein
VCGPVTPPLPPLFFFPAGPAPDWLCGLGFPYVAPRVSGRAIEEVQRGWPGWSLWLCLSSETVRQLVEVMR